LIQASVPALVAGLVLASGCVPPGDPAPAAAGGDVLAATGVTVRLAVAGGGLVARARTLELGPDGGILLAGDASVALDAGTAFEARAERIALDAETGAALLEGRVRARLIPAMPGVREGDGGADR
jgi:hypothetical protein